MNMMECKCGTLYVTDSKKLFFKCSSCRRFLFPFLQKSGEKKKKSPAEEQKVYRDRESRLWKWLFLMGCSVGIFSLLLMVPTLIMFKEAVPVMVFLMVLELAFGTLLICASLSLYLLNLQVKSLQSLVTFQQHNLRIVADQISRLFYILRSKE